MEYLGIPFSVKNVPCLQPDFLPFAPWRTAYLSQARQPFRIAVEGSGTVVYETRIRGGSPADLRYPDGYRIPAVSGNDAGRRDLGRSKPDRSVSRKSRSSSDRQHGNPELLQLSSRPSLRVLQRRWPLTRSKTRSSVSWPVSSDLPAITVSKTPSFRTGYPSSAANAV